LFPIALCNLVCGISVYGRRSEEKRAFRIAFDINKR
jgi:hypothetical protein